MAMAQHFDLEIIYEMLNNRSDQVSEYYNKISQELVDAGVLRDWAEIPMADKYNGEKHKRSKIVREHYPEYVKMVGDVQSMFNEWREVLDYSDHFTGEDLLSVTFTDTEGVA